MELPRQERRLVDERRKHAYRYLLYWAMLEIRAIAWLRSGWLRTWNPFYWRRDGRLIQRAGVIADWLHNLAIFSSIDFQRFDEERFWRDFESFRRRYPDFGLERYRNLFEERISETFESRVTAEPSAATEDVRNPST